MPTGQPFPFDISVLTALFKWAYMLGLSIYVIFALVAIKQVSQMTKAVNGPLTPFMILTSWLHFGVALSIFIWAILIL